jgi:peptidoglycan/LPS O-acetylase OafA/YrhL
VFIIPSAADRLDATTHPNPVAPSNGNPASPDTRRPALDGIRALAVLAVVLYHFGGGDASWLPGGFLGVDVFFVLSGYLISRLLLEEYERHGRIDLRAFWARRARRLSPAFVAMLLIVSAWGWWATPMESFPSRRSDLMWSLTYLMNWHLIQNGDDYFATYATASPLRHTWSLAVEEQFYLFWPLLLAGLLWAGQKRIFGGSVRPKRTPIPRLTLVAVTVMIAAVVSIWIMADSYNALAPSVAYYATQGRIQELFVGVLLAVLLTWWRTGHVGEQQLPGIFRQQEGRLATAAATVATIGLLVAFVRMSDATSFYYRGGALLVSVAVAVLIGALDAHPDGMIAKGFSWSPMVALGRISYGVYLWHWPIVVAIPIKSGDLIGDQIWRQTERLGLTVALAFLSYRFIEQPILRDRRWFTSKRRVLIAVLASSGLVLGVAWPTTALPGTLTQQLLASSDRPCPGERVDRLLVCTAPEGTDATTHPPELALLGDSTGRALAPGLDDWAQRTGTTWIKAAWKRCTPVNLMVVPSDLAVPDLPATACHAQAPGLIRNMLATYRPSTVLIAEYWDINQPLLVDGVRVEAGTSKHDTALRIGYEQLVDEIAQYGGRAVLLELPPPGASIGEQYAAGRPAGDARATASGERSAARYNQLLKEVVNSRPGRAGIVSLTDVICPGNECPAVIGDTLVRRDGVHYSVKLSRQLVPILMQRMGLEPR